MLADLLHKHLGDAAANVVIRLLIVVAILLITWLVRQFVGAIVPRVVRRLRRWTRSTWDERIVDALLPPARFFVTVLGAWSAAIALELPSRVYSTLATLMNSLVALTLFWTIFRLVDPSMDIFLGVSRRTMRTTVGGLPSLLDEKLGAVLKQLGHALIVILGMGAVINVWGYDVAGIVAGLGIGGLAVALAAQDTLSNLFGYFVILADEPFNIGEYIVLDSVSGTVETVGLRSTRIRVLDQSIVSVPNKTIANANITNWSRLAKRRLNMTLGIEYSSSPQQVLSVVQAIREMLINHELVQKDSVTVQFVEFNASSLDLMIICFMNTPAWGDFQAAKQDINLKIMEILDERGVSVAFPSRTIYLQQAELPQGPSERFVPPTAPEPTVSTATDSPVPDDAAN